MFMFGCDNCLTVVAIKGDHKLAEELLLAHGRWKDGWPCVTDGCSANMDFILSKDLQRQLMESKDLVSKFYELTPREFFSALCGFGLPDELGCAPEVVEAMLLSSRVVGLRVRESPTNRTIVDAIELDNGAVLHLSASPHGASVFKITRKRDEQADHDLRSLQPDPKGDGLQHEDDRGPGGADDGGSPGGGTQPHQLEQRDDGGDHRGHPHDAAGAPGREGDNDPQDPQEADGGERGEGGEGVRAGPEDGGLDQDRPAGGAEAVRAD